MLTIVCEPCNRRGSYDVQRLKAQHSDAKLTDLFRYSQTARRRAPPAIYDRCKAVFEGLAV